MLWQIKLFLEFQTVDFFAIVLSSGINCRLYMAQVNFMHQWLFSKLTATVIWLAFLASCLGFLDHFLSAISSFVLLRNFGFHGHFLLKRHARHFQRRSESQIFHRKFWSYWNRWYCCLSNVMFDRCLDCLFHLWGDYLWLWGRWKLSLFMKFIFLHLCQN